MISLFWFIISIAAIIYGFVTISLLYVVLGVIGIVIVLNDLAR